MRHEFEIDRNSSEPIYSQLSNMLKRQISKGIYLPGSRLPTEAELRRKYDLSPMTVRRAIGILLDKGIVETVRGSGTYVRIPNFQEVTFSLKVFTDIFIDTNRTIVNILEASIQQADKMTAQKLSIQQDEETILIKRVLLRDGDPIVFHKEFLIYDPTRPVVESEMEITSLHGLLVGSGETNLKGGDLSIEASVLTKEEADMLNTFEMQPAFHIEHLFYDFNEEPFSWGRFVCRADSLKFTAPVGYRNEKRK